MKSKTIIAIGLTLFIIQLILSITLWVMRPPAIALVDIKKVITDFSQQLATSNLSGVDKDKVSTKFAKALPLAIENYSNKHNVILLNPAVVVTSKNDVTPAIEQEIAKNMKGEA